MNELAYSQLKQHQIEGIQFLYREIVIKKDDSKVSGCLLSHIIGLGKSIQVITLLATTAEVSASKDEAYLSQTPHPLPSRIDVELA